MPADVVRPVAPDRERVAEEPLEGVARRPHCQPPPRGPAARSASSSARSTVRPARESSSIARTTSGRCTASRRSAKFSAPIASGSPPYQASGSAPMTRSGVSGCAKKNQWYHSVANSGVIRSRCSTIGMLSIRATRRTASGWSIASRKAT